MKKKRKKKQASDGRKDGRWDSITRRTILAWPVIVRRVEFSWFGTLSTVSRYAAILFVRRETFTSSTTLSSNFAPPSALALMDASY